MGGFCHCAEIEEIHNRLQKHDKLFVICNGNDKTALKYSVKAAKLCADFEQTNPALTSNIYGNLSSLYHADGQLEKSKKYAEKAYNILKPPRQSWTRRRRQLPRQKHSVR